MQYVTCVDAAIRRLKLPAFHMTSLIILDRAKNKTNIVLKYTRIDKPQIPLSLNVSSITQVDVGDPCAENL